MGDQGSFLNGVGEDTTSFLRKSSFAIHILKVLRIFKLQEDMYVSTSKSQSCLRTSLVILNVSKMK